MDPMMQQMLADLGLDRRDQVSAPDADGRSHAMGTNAREQAAIRVEVQARQARASASRGGGEQQDKRSAILRAWNTESSFERDAVTSQLQDRSSGQGHRAEMRRRLGTQYDARVEAVDARVGEERRIYLQERSNREVNHGSPPGHRGPRKKPVPVHGANDFQSRLASNAGRAQGNQSYTASTEPSRGRHGQISLPQNRARAQSPRAMGTIRYGPGGQRTIRTPGGTRAFNIRGTNTVAASPSTPPSMNIPASMQASMHAPRPSVSSASAMSSSPTPLSHAPCPANNEITPGAAATVFDQVHHNLALWHAANPGKECDAYYEKYPERLRYHDPARDQLVKECIALAKKDDAPVTATYVETHRDRKWMIEAASRAKELVEIGTEKDTEKYYIANPVHEFFLRAAKATFTRKAPIPRADTPVQISPVPITSQQTSPKHAIPQQPVRKRSNPKQAIQPSSRDTSPLSSPNTRPSRSNSIATVDTASSAPASSSVFHPVGSLAATFYGIANEFMGIHQAGISVPAHVKIDVTAQSNSVDPRILISSIEALAESLKAASKTGQGAVGITLAQDDVWSDGEVEGGEYVNVARRRIPGAFGAGLPEDALWKDDDDDEEL